MAASVHWSSCACSPFAYYLAVTLTSTPFNIVGGLVLFLLVYGMVGLKLTAGAILVSCAAVAIYSLIAIQVPPAISSAD